MDPSTNTTLTGVLAIWGAALATIALIWQIYNEWIRDRASVEVRTAIALTTEFHGPLLAIEAVNRGRRPITLNSAWVELPAVKEKMFFGTFYMKNFPCELNEGKTCNILHPLDEMQKNLHGKSKGSYVVVKDTMNRMYRSKSIEKLLEPSK